MLLFQYLDLLPAIPEHLLENPIPNYHHNNIGYTDGNNYHEAKYTRWGTNEKILEWLKTNIAADVTISGIQIMSWANQVSPGQRKVNPHCDKRKWALNYVYEPGGSNVATTFYQEQGHSVLRAPGTRLTDFSKLEVIQSSVIESRRWHILNTNVLHGVTNVETTRKAVTIGINLENPFDAINGYCTQTSNGSV